MSHIFITGVSSGIGKNLLRSYIQSGHNVSGVVRTKEQKQILLSEYPKAQIFISDLSDIQSGEKLSNDIKKEKFDVMIFNAGYGTYRNFGETKTQEILPQIMVNLYSPLFLLSSSIDTVKGNNTKIVFISSITTAISLKKLSIYIASKGGLNHFYRVFKKENPEIASLLLEIGATKTPMHIKSGMEKQVGKDLDKVTKKIIKAIEKKKGIKRLYLDWWMISKIGRIITAIFS